MDVFDSCLPTGLDPAAVIETVARDPRLRAFTGHGKIETLPARQARRHLLLDTIAQAFEPGMRYSERQVSLLLGALHADYAALRRYLVDEDFLSRSDGQYWRSGGTVLPSPPDAPRAQALPSEHVHVAPIDQPNPTILGNPSSRERTRRGMSGRVCSGDGL
jgi:hypothetical protein